MAKILWVSPYGEGWSIAYKLRESGHKVVYWCPAPENTNGAGYLPRLESGAEWIDYAKRSDVVLVDATPASRQTRRSWEPSDLSFALQGLRHHGVSVIGPTPTTELLQNDRRYLRKTLAKCGLSLLPAEREGAFVVPVTLSLGPFGQLSLGFREGFYGEVVTGDVVLPLQPCALSHRSVGLLQSLLDITRHSTYFNLDLAVTATDVYVVGAHAGQMYPAVFAHLGDLLGVLDSAGGVVDREDQGAPQQEPSRAPALVTTLFHRFDTESPAALDELLHEPGVFGFQFQHPERDHPQSGGATRDFIAGALVVRDREWGQLSSKADAELQRLTGLYGLEHRLGDGILHDIPALIKQLHTWGYLS